MFGVDRSVPGLLVFPSPKAQNLSPEQGLDEIWNLIEEANTRAEGFSQIGREMVLVLPQGAEAPVTDKDSIKRSQVYRDFADIIDSAYKRLESNQEGSLNLSVEELESWIMERFEELGVVLEGKEADFFST